MLFILRCVGVVGLVVIAAIAGPTMPPASAHPFGDPQTVMLQREADQPRVVHVQWKAGAIDDLALLADYLRLSADGDRGGGVDLGESVRAAQSLSTAPEFQRYLLDHIAATTQGSACTGAVDPITSLVGDGAGLTFTCARQADDLRLEVTTLTDLHPAYKTFATGPGGRRAIYDSTHTTHDWSMSATASAGADLLSPSLSSGRSAAIQLSMTGGGMLAAAVIGWAWLRRRGKRVNVA